MVILPPQIIIIAIAIAIATITTTKIIKNIGGGPEWSFAPGPPDTFAQPWVVPLGTNLKSYFSISYNNNKMVEETCEVGSTLAPDGTGSYSDVWLLILVTMVTLVTLATSDALVMVSIVPCLPSLR
jgi:low affinity Fe/Cu permease